MTSLCELSLGWCRSLGSSSRDESNNIAPLTALTALTSLNLARTKVTDDGCSVIGQLPLLKTLDLSGCPVSEQGLIALGACGDTLIKLCLRGCKVRKFRM